MDELFTVELPDDIPGAHVEYAPSHQSGIYKFNVEYSDRPVYLVFNTRNGELNTDGKTISGFQKLGNNTQVYIYLETQENPIKIGTHQGDKIQSTDKNTKGKNAYYIIEYPKGTKEINLRYGVSFISTDQAEKNLRREIKKYDLNAVAQQAKNIWNESLGKISISGGTESQKAIFYTSLYRTYERMICISEDGKYFSAYDGKIHVPRHL